MNELKITIAKLLLNNGLGLDKLNQCVEDILDEFFRAGGRFE